MSHSLATIIAKDDASAVTTPRIATTAPTAKISTAHDDSDHHCPHCDSAEDAPATPTKTTVSKSQSTKFKKPPKRKRYKRTIVVLARNHPSANAKSLEKKVDEKNNGVKSNSGGYHDDNETHLPEEDSDVEQMTARRRSHPKKKTDFEAEADPKKLIDEASYTIAANIHDVCISLHPRMS